MTDQPSIVPADDQMVERETAPLVPVADDPPPGPVPDPDEPDPVQTDNGPKSEDGDQSTVDQDPAVDLSQGDSL